MPHECWQKGVLITTIQKYYMKSFLTTCAIRRFALAVCLARRSKANAFQPASPNLVDRAVGLAGGIPQVDGKFSNGRSSKPYCNRIPTGIVGMLAWVEHERSAHWNRQRHHHGSISARLECYSIPEYANVVLLAIDHIFSNDCSLGGNATQRIGTSFLPFRLRWWLLLR